MGTGFTIDTPLRVAKYGISSAMSLVDDILIEQMRKFHCEKEGEEYVEIGDGDDDSRARRITAYLDLMALLVTRQVHALQAMPFDEGSEITRYFSMLPESPLKRRYTHMLSSDDAKVKAKEQEELRLLAVPGSIDVNIMTKLDRSHYMDGHKQPAEFNDAMAALRGYAKSVLSSSIVFSAGMNPNLYDYLSTFADFFADSNGYIRKKIVLKVSDYRSALVQGKFLAKRGLWVSEYRIESSLNCGGHAFATKGFLIGPILEEFRGKRKEFLESVSAVYAKACLASGLAPSARIHETRITVQGGIGTAEEDAFLMQHYDIHGTGWGTPFLLAPDVVNMDDVHLDKLTSATAADVYLSATSPLGVPFWSLRNSASEEARRKRIREGKPGSSCPKRYIALDTEHSEVPVCTGGRSYQKRALQLLQEAGHPPELLRKLQDKVREKSCVCHDVGGTATLRHGIDPDATPTICCGINITNFSARASLEEMVGHIYGRISLLGSTNRVHMFVQELQIYIDHLRAETDSLSLGLSIRTAKYMADFKDNLLAGIKYYRVLARRFVGKRKQRFVADLEALRKELESIPPVVSV